MAGAKVDIVTVGAVHAIADSAYKFMVAEEAYGTGPGRCGVLRCVVAVVHGCLILMAAIVLPPHGAAASRKAGRVSSTL